MDNSTQKAPGRVADLSQVLFYGEKQEEGMTTAQQAGRGAGDMAPASRSFRETPKGPPVRAPVPALCQASEML